MFHFNILSPRWAGDYSKFFKPALCKRGESYFTG
jgi:hypothetical protein